MPPLGSPKRICTLQAAGTNVNNMTTPEIGRHVGFSRQALNRHVSILEEAGVIRRTLNGRVHEVTLVRSPLDEMADWVSIIRRGWEGNLDRLGNILGGNDV